MNSDPIELPAFVIADLYKSSLVEMDETIHSNSLPQENATLNAHIPPNEAEPKLENIIGIKYLGNNNKNVLIVLNNTIDTIINADEQQFLTNILKACKLTMDDIAIINSNNQPLNFNELKEEMGAKYLLLFGVAPGDVKLPFIIPMYQVQQYAGCTIVAAPALTELNNAAPEVKHLKIKLWESLKRCFNI